MNEWRAVSDFEAALADYTGAPHVAVVNSCTSALYMAFRYLRVETISVPRRTYASVPYQVENAGGRISWSDLNWCGDYQLSPYPVIDSARRFTSGMYKPGNFVCVSFHHRKILKIGTGGAILCPDETSAEWFRSFAFHGRKRGLTPNEQTEWRISGMDFRLYRTLCEEGIRLLRALPKHNADLPNDDYPDLSKPPFQFGQRDNQSNRIAAYRDEQIVAGNFTAGGITEPLEANRVGRIFDRCALAGSIGKQPFNDGHVPNGGRSFPERVEEAFRRHTEERFVNL